jgi:competence protein ComEC
MDLSRRPTLPPSVPAVVLLLLVAVAPAGAAEPEMRIHFIDVGQGAATLIEFPCGAMLVDTGGEDSDGGSFHSTPALTAYLDAFFARRKDLGRTLDLLVLTHPHIDHIRGAPTVLDTYKVRGLVDNGQTPKLEEAIEVMSAVRAYTADHPDLPYLAVRTDEFPADGRPLTSPILDPFGRCKGVDPTVTALWGQVPSDPGWGEDDYGKARFDNENNHSVVTRVDFGKASLLITGDLEAVGIHDLLDVRAPSTLDVDIYEVGHHGSYNGTTLELLQAMTPAWAVMENGPPDRHGAWTAWQYGHPRQPAIDLLEQEVTGLRDPPVTEQIGTSVKRFTQMVIDKAIYATGWDGSLVLEANAEGQITRGAPDLASPPRATAPTPAPTTSPATTPATAPAPASAPTPAAAPPGSTPPTPAPAPPAP